MNIKIIVHAKKFIVVIFISNHVTIDSYHYLAKKQNIKMENNGIKKVDIKNHTCFYFNGFI